MAVIASPEARRARRRSAPALVERRFPLHLEPAILTIRDLYHQAKKAKWDPEKHIPWADFDATRYGVEQLAAGRLSWSRRAWTEYGGLPETPAILVRFCLELEGESDPKLFLSVRGTEEAWHTECCYRFADTQGGYITRPSNPTYESLFNQDFHREAFDPGLTLDSYVGAHVAILDGIDLELYRGYLRYATDPVARAILKRLVQDKERHVAFGWVYLNTRKPKWTQERIAEIAGEIETVLGDLEFNGYHCAWLVPENAAADVVAADRITRAAGLGALTPEEERAIFRRWYADTRSQLAKLGIAIADRSDRIGSE